jgi:5-methylcytosine-specific restriction endonuclease McrBC GTP-binding regulatory subunit McrB
MSLYKLLLLGTSGCHLCEQAEEIMEAYRQSDDKWIIEIVDIAEQEQWQALYATRIPVLYSQETGSALGWPFDLLQVTQFIDESCLA